MHQHFGPCSWRFSGGVVSSLVVSPCAISTISGFQIAFPHIIQWPKKILYNYHIIALNCPMLKQGIKTISTKFIWTCALYWLFWFSSDLCNLFPRVSSLFDVNVKKKKRPGRWFWTLCLHSRPLLTIDARVEGLVSNMDYL